MSSLFTVTELQAQGDGTYVETPVRFEWDAARQSSPRDGWPYGVKQRSRREDYAGADLPTEQVLGGNFKPFTLKGVWLDRYNFQGFAEQTRQAFEDLVLRGNLVRLSLQGMTFTGLITDFDPVYRTPTRCEYAFTLSPHYRKAGGDARRQRTVQTSIRAGTDPQAYADRAAQLALQARELHKSAPPVLFMVGGLYTGVGDNVSTLIDRANTVQSIINNRVLAISAEQDAANSFSRLVQSFSAIADTSRALIDQLASTPSVDALAFESAMSVLGYETWARELSNTARQMIVMAAEAGADLAKRVTPETMAFYKPYAGESLYAISTRFYGTPDRWRDIYKQNDLTSFTLTGLELLDIPARR